MSSNMKPTKYAHASGHTDVCYAEDGVKLITCGNDGDVRIWASVDDNDPFQICLGQWALCVRQKGKKILTATNNNVQLLTYPNGKRDSILTRFSAPVTHMAVGKDHNFVAIASEDMEIKMIDLSNPKDSPKNFPGVNGPPLSIALCRNAEILAVSAGDGFLRFWDVKTTSILKELKCVTKANSFANATLLCRMDFEPTIGQRVAYPQDNTIVILNATDWSIASTLRTDSTDSPFSIVQYSPCGKFIAAANNKGDVVVWEIKSRNVVEYLQHPSSKAICALVWNPAERGQIAFCDVEGRLSIVVDCISNSKHKDDDGSDVGNDIDFGDIQFEDDADNENAVSLEKLKSSTLAISDNEDDDTDKANSFVMSRPSTPEVQMQPPFMPSSTPDHLDPRYLCWNEVGIVRSYGAVKGGDGNKSIEAEFHDATFHSSMMIQNFKDYTMAVLSTAAFVLANSEQIQVIPLLSGTKDWVLTLEQPLNIICIAASTKLICFATTNYLVHVCTLYGTQKSIFSIPGPIVCMAAHNNSLLIAYHHSKPRNGDQCIQFMLITLEGLSMYKTDLNNTLGPECTLFWMGFTDSGSPAVLDSNEILFIYLTKSNMWVSFCDTRKHATAASDGFFVTAVSELSVTVRGVRCKGSRYPNFVLRPMLSELPLQPMFAEIASEKAQLAANLFMCSHLQVENTEKKCKETTLKSFALACRNSLDQRAFELIELFNDKQVVNLALRYASKLDKRRLLEKLTDLQSKLQSGDGDDVFNALPPVEPQPTIKPNRKLILQLAERNTPKNRQRKHLNTENTPNSSSVHSLPTTITAADSTLENSTMLDITQEINETINPFTKSLKKPAPATPNPLSLTDKYAGYELEAKENVAKRKHPETSSETANPKEKQRKLVQFSFMRRT